MHLTASRLVLPFNWRWRLGVDGLLNTDGQLENCYSRWEDICGFPSTNLLIKGTTEIKKLEAPQADKWHITEKRTTVITHSVNPARWLTGRRNLYFRGHIRLFTSGPSGKFTFMLALQVVQVSRNNLLYGQKHRKGIHYHSTYTQKNLWCYATVYNKPLLPT